MRSCYSLDPTDISAAYKEQEYRQKADDYRLLQSIKVMNQEVKNGLENVETGAGRMPSVVSSIFLKYTNTYFRRRQHDLAPFYLANRNTR
jgi:hypothetical protein